MEQNISTEVKPMAPLVKSSLSDWIMDDFLPQHGSKALYVAIGIFVAGIAWMIFSNQNEKSKALDNKALGKAYVFLSEDKMDSAEIALSAYVQGHHSGVALSKAYLMLGKVKFQKQQYDEAISAYSKVDASGDQSLLSSGALHGIAASYMQKKDYPKAIESLEKFVSHYMRKNGNLEERAMGKEPRDLSPVVPNALWKLALCYAEQKDADKEKATAEKLIKVYAESKEALDAKKLLAQI